MKAAVLAGGFGTRIHPLTVSVPKPMLPVMNRPLLEHALDTLDPLHPSDISFFLYFMPEKIRHWFEARPREGCRFHFVVPDADYGTAGTLAFGRAQLDETFVVVSGDLVTDFDLASLVESHRRTGALATLALTTVANPLQYGVVVVGDDGRVRRFVEKPGWGEVVSDLVNTGVYVLEPEVLEHLPPGRPFDFARGLFPLLLKRGLPVFGWPMEGYWRDVGNPEAYRQVHADLFAGRVRVRPPGRRVPVGEGDAWLEEGAEVSPRARVAGSIVVGRGVKLPRGFYARSVFGEGTEVGEGCSIEGSVLWNDVLVGAGSRVRNSLICDEVRLGEEVYIPDGAVVASGSVVQERVTLEHNVTVGPGKVVEAGSVLAANLISGERWTPSLFCGNKVAGNTNAEMSAAFCARLGEAFGTFLSEGSRILVSRDYHKASRMLFRSFLGGVLGTGVDARDLSPVPYPVALFSLSTLGEAGGVHIRQKPEDGDATEILFHDGQGFPLGEDKAKAVERIFTREEVRRARHDESGTMAEMPHAVALYRERFLAEVGREAIRRRGFSLVLDLAHGLTAEVLPSVLADLGVEAVVLNAHRDESRLSVSPAEVRGALARVGKIVRCLKADMGFYLFPSGERLLMVDGRGVARSDHEAILFLLSLLGAAGDDKARAVLPAQAPRVAISRIPRVSVTYGRASALDPRSLPGYEAIFCRGGRYAFPRFMPHADGMFAVAAVLDLLARSGHKASEVFASLPPCSFLRAAVECPAEKLGKVMRGFREEAGTGDLTYEDGIQASYPWGGVSLTPDDTRARVYLHVEAGDARTARRETSRWTRLLARWANGGPPRQAGE